MTINPKTVPILFDNHGLTAEMMDSHGLLYNLFESGQFVGQIRFSESMYKKKMVYGVLNNLDLRNPVVLPILFFVQDHPSILQDAMKTLTYYLNLCKT